MPEDPSEADVQRFVIALDAPYVIDQQFHEWFRSSCRQLQNALAVPAQLLSESQPQAEDTPRDVPAKAPKATHHHCAKCGPYHPVGLVVHECRPTAWDHILEGF